MPKTPNPKNMGYVRTFRTWYVFNHAHAERKEKRKNSYRESASGREKERKRYRAPYVCKYDVHEMQSNSVSDNMDVCPPTRTTQASKHKPPHGTPPVLFAPVPIAVKWSEFVP